MTVIAAREDTGRRRHTGGGATVEPVEASSAVDRVVGRIQSNARANRERAARAANERARREAAQGPGARDAYLAGADTDQRAIDAGVAVRRPDVTAAGSRPAAALSGAARTQRLSPGAERIVAQDVETRIERASQEPIIANEDGRILPITPAQRITLTDYITAHPRAFPSFEEFFDAIAGLTGVDLADPASLEAVEFARSAWEAGGGHGREPETAQYETSDGYRARRGSRTFEAHYSSQRIDGGVDPATGQRRIVGLRTSPIAGMDAIPEPPADERGPVSPAVRSRRDLDGARMRQRIATQQAERQAYETANPRTQPFMVRLPAAVIANAEADAAFRARELGGRGKDIFTGAKRNVRGGKQMQLAAEQFVDAAPPAEVQPLNLTTPREGVDVTGQRPIAPQRVDGTQTRGSRTLAANPRMAAVGGAAAVLSGAVDIPIGDSGVSVGADGVSGSWKF